MYNPVVVHKGRTTTVRARLGIDVSTDELTSQIRSEPKSDSTLIATWAISFDTDGTDGVLILTLDNSDTEGDNEILYANGYMDIKRVINEEPVSVFDAPIPVTFRDVVTV